MLTDAVIGHRDSIEAVELLASAARAHKFRDRGDSEWASTMLSEVEHDVPRHVHQHDAHVFRASESSPFFIETHF